MAGQTPTPLFQECVGFSRNPNSHFVGNKKLCIMLLFGGVSSKEVGKRRGGLFLVSVWKKLNP